MEAFRPERGVVAGGSVNEAAGGAGDKKGAAHLPERLLCGWQ